MAGRARAEVESRWDMAVITAKLVEEYRMLVEEKRRNAMAALPLPASPPLAPGC